MTTKEEDLVQIIMILHRLDRYEEILNQLSKVTQEGNAYQKRTLKNILWPCPTNWDLIVLSKFIVSRQIINIYSIGCGTALLEYLLKKFVEAEYSERLANSQIGEKNEKESKEKNGIISLNKNKIKNGIISNKNGIKKPAPAKFKLTNVEIDSRWWASSYSPPVFDKLYFAGEDFSDEDEFGEFGDLSIFSYFNSLKYFINYLKRFRGSYIVIIGPIAKQFSSPAPLDLKNNDTLPNSEWNLILYQRFGLEIVDYIAVYSRAEFY